MNILIPDIWLRDYLTTKATPKEIKEYLSLCGPSVERIYGAGKQTVYDIEITGNRPDAMSVMGVAREAATILPRFRIDATLTGDPYRIRTRSPKAVPKLKLKLKTDPELNPRWMSAIFENVSVRQSPAWLRTYLELAGMRAINSVVDITNFLMRAYGQPAHVFDYDAINNHTMTLRASRPGETLVTLDGKSHKLPGGDIVIEDGTGKLVDLCGIMGGENSSVTEKTTRVVLFLQTYNPAAIRKTSMTLSHRTEASSLFEKGLDTELVRPVFFKGAELMNKLTGGELASAVIDIYPQPYKPKTVSVSLEKISAYIGNLPDSEVRHILSSLGFGVTLTKRGISVRVPSFRRDVSLDVDVIEEIARVHGYHNIPSALPDGAPPVTQPDRELLWEDQIKIRLRDWGYTELITYSMVSGEQMDRFGQSTNTAYKISNPLSSDWVYMRPNLSLSMLPALKQNLSFSKDLMLFELGNTYRYRKNDLPDERPTLTVMWSGRKFLEAKGLAEAMLEVFGLTAADVFTHQSKLSLDWYTEESSTIGSLGTVGVLSDGMRSAAEIPVPVTQLVLDIPALVAAANPVKRYMPVPKHPPSVEDLAFIVPEHFAVGPLISLLQSAHEYVERAELLDVHGNTRTFHITYVHPEKTLTSGEIARVRNVLLAAAKKEFGISLKQ